MSKLMTDWIKIELRIRGVLKDHYTKKLGKGVTLDDTISSLDAIDNMLWEETGRGSESDFAELEKDLAEKKKQDCPDCDGSGTAFANDPPTGYRCEHCDGTGKI